MIYKYDKGKYDRVKKIKSRIKRKLRVTKSDKKLLEEFECFRKSIVHWK